MAKGAGASAQGLLSVLQAMPDLLFWFIKLARLSLAFQLADDLFEELHRFEAGLALVALDMQLDAAVPSVGDVQFVLWSDQRYRVRMRLVTTYIPTTPA